MEHIKSSPQRPQVHMTHTEEMAVLKRGTNEEMDCCVSKFSLNPDHLSMNSQHHCNELFVDAWTYYSSTIELEKRGCRDLLTMQPS